MDTVVIRGRTLLSLEGIARCYRIEIEWVREVYELGLLGEGTTWNDTVVLEFEVLDRVAEICRLQEHVGANLAGIALLFAENR